MKLLFVYTLTMAFLCSCGERKAYLIDNVVASKEEFEALDTSDIFSIKPNDPGNANSCFPGRKNIVPVVIVTSRKAEEERQKQRHALLHVVLNLAAGQKDLLVIKNGLLYPLTELEALRNLSSSELSGTIIMAEDDARRLYGSYSKPITLVINTY